MNKMSSAALCAHLHDTCGHVASQRDIDTFVSTIYGSSRTIELCKEIAQYCKCVVAEVPLDISEIHHLPIRQGSMIGGNAEIPQLSTKSFELINKITQMPLSDSRDKMLILLTKLHCYVLPLVVCDAVGKVGPMIDNIETDREVDSNLLSDFRQYITSNLDRHLLAQTTAKGEKISLQKDWYKRTMPLHDLAMKYHTSQKRRPSMVYVKKTDSMYYGSETRMGLKNPYVLSSILTNSKVRCLYQRHKAEFISLVTGKPTLSVLDDTDLLRYPTIDAPIGRMGMRLQEAEKIRLLWMPLAVFESLTQPATEILEFLVRTSQHQSAYLDDYESAQVLHDRYFHNNERSQDMIVSADQSSFTDTFSWKLQRIVLERLNQLGLIPDVTLEAMELQATGEYRPASFFKQRYPSVHFHSGTPMGGYGFWMLCSYSHEQLVSMVQESLGRRPDSMIQGDDAVFRGLDTYEAYVDIMSKCGCSVNKQKTIISNRMIEYCGMIITPTQITPMFRPHDRFKCHVSDVASPRAKQAFGEDKIASWVINNRPEIFDQLRIEGYLSINDEDADRDIIVSARSIFEASQKVSMVLPPDRDEERYSLIGEIQEYYPQCIIDEVKLHELTVHIKRSPIEEYQWKSSMVKGLYNHLLHNAHCDLVRVTNRIVSLCDDIMENHKDHMALFRNDSNESMADRSEFPAKFRKEKPDNRKKVETCLRLARERIGCSPNKQLEDDSHDDYQLSQNK